MRGSSSACWSLDNEAIACDEGLVDVQGHFRLLRTVLVTVNGPGENPSRLEDSGYGFLLVHVSGP